MSSNAVPENPSGGVDPARFVNEVWPLIDVLARGARRLTHNDADAEDLLQETLLRAYTGFGSFRGGTNLQAWLFRIMRNRWINDHRWRQRRPAETLAGALNDNDLGEHGLQRRVSARSAEAALLDALPNVRVKAALSALPVGFAAVLFYVAVEGYSYAETAALLDIPIGTVMSRMSRARKQLRGALSDDEAAAPADLVA